MVLRKKARRSDEDALRARLNALPEEGLDQFNAPLTDAVHLKPIRPPTARVHARVRNLWSLFVTLSNDPEVQTIGKEITPAMVTPSAAVVKAFVRFLAMTVQGILETPDDPDAPAPATVSTMISYVDTLYSVLSREGRVVVDKDVRTQVRNYLASDDLRRLVPLSTMQREKHYASVEDVRKLVDAYYTDTLHFRTNRMRVQMAALTLLLAISTERIGAVVESNCYRGTNAALTWKDIAVVVTPNPGTPSRPDVALKITVGLLKGGRDVESYSKTFTVFPERRKDRAYCPVLPLIFLGVLDRTWESIDGPEDIFSPRVPPTIQHMLRTHPEKRDLIVFRAETKSAETGWSISSSEAMDYGATCRHLRFFSRLNGFPVDVRPYDIRRGTANVVANDPSISVEQRERIMAHSVRSKTYQRSYESMAVRVDVQGALCGGQQEERLAFIARAEDMSRGADPEAPTRASAAGLIESYYRDDAIIALYREKNNGHENTNEVRKELSAAIAREQRHLSEEERRSYFATSSTRQLEGVAPPLTHRVASLSEAGSALLARHKRPDVAAILLEKACGSFTDCVDALVRHLYGEVVETDRHDALLDACRLLLAMPIACHPLCYPGESPTPENRCPVCDCVCRFEDMDRGAGYHIHHCLAKAKQSEADEELDASYVPAQCRWEGCRLSGKTWPSRREFVAHVRTHTRTARACGWVDFDGAPCGQGEVGDWLTHFARCHGVNARDRATLNYCYVCSECRQHYDDLFAPFSQRREVLDVEPVGIYIYPEAYNRVGYDLGSGLGGQFPEYHGHIEHGVAFAPMFCVWCVNNQDLPIVTRMTQYHNQTVFSKHLKTHTSVINAPTVCPSPHCGLKTFNKDDLLCHLVTVHRLGVCGTDRVGPDRRLRLSETSKRPLADEPSSIPVEGRKRPRKKDGPTFKCKGCYKVFQQIDAHIAMGKKCRRIARYVRVVDGEVIGEEIRWTQK
ncbi:hypothetical protein JVU11DRAFT_9114 [Chiua virens]|nr:hypothetical protein JVU11DRAFT_9114 [Chiua virens]